VVSSTLIKRRGQRHRLSLAWADAGFEDLGNLI
jgi:hypothetical protein